MLRMSVERTTVLLFYDDAKIEKNYYLTRSVMMKLMLLMIMLTLVML